jgi:hypothetical protein
VEEKLQLRVSLLTEKMHGQRRLPPGEEMEEWFKAKLAERNAKV